MSFLMRNGKEDSCQSRSDIHSNKKRHLKIPIAFLQPDTLKTPYI